MLHNISEVLSDTHGERYGAILYYFIPEIITAFLLYSLPGLLDSYFIGHLKSTTMYNALGTANTLLHWLLKLAEGISVGTVIVAGRLNGMQYFTQVGKSLRDAFWLTIIIGLSLALFLYTGAYWIYDWYGVPVEIMPYGIPFLRVRAISIFLAFIFAALVGFLRGIKNTFVPMVIYSIGSILFVICDYLLIPGNWGFPTLGLQGSAIASLIQYSIMVLLAFGYVVFYKENRKYSIQLFRGIFHLQYAWELIVLSLPVMLDKALFAGAYMWLCKMMWSIDTQVAPATFNAIKDIERFSFLPAVALAQVITFLVSNDLGAHNWRAIKVNIKKVLLIAAICVAITLGFVTTHIDWALSFFDKTGTFTPFAATVFPYLSLFVFFDLVQLILSGALRGAGDVRTVMLVRFLVICLYFIPVSYWIAHIPMESKAFKFMLIYGSFYIGNALMSVVYVVRFKGHAWKKSLPEGN